jgi:hypothetical protein
MDIRFERSTRARILMHLFNNSKPQGMSILHWDPAPMTIREAQEEIKKHTGPSGVAWFDYLLGRVIKVGIGDNTVYRADLFDRDLGEGACQNAIDEAETHCLIRDEYRSE